MASKDDQSLVDKVALVTGATRGIGKAVAAAYAGAGARVFICARGESEVEQTARELSNRGAQVEGCAGDIGQSADARRIVETALTKFGALHVVVNNASLLGPRVPLAEYPFEQWEKVMRVNLSGVFLVIQQALKSMIAQRQGSIINVSSGVGRTGKARWGAYAVSKFGVEGLTQVLADEVKEFGIRVNSVNPGPTRTAMRAAAYPQEDPSTLHAPEQITPVFVYLASDDSRDVTGQAFEAQDWLEPRR
jgi:NAD(P)-dependent dehydrogenase (short-subunit alcohol dehydrogenase family)